MQYNYQEIALSNLMAKLVLGILCNLQAQDNLVQNIMIWANDIAGLNTAFPELEPELEKLALELI